MFGALTLKYALPMNVRHFEYKKGNPDIYSLLQQYGREDLAKRFAQQLRALYTGTNYAAHKPCTMVDKLVEELEHPDTLLMQRCPRHRGSPRLAGHRLVPQRPSQHHQQDTS